MQSAEARNEFQTPENVELRSPVRHNKLERVSWINWFLLTGGGFLTIVWLAGADIILLSAQGINMDQLWPPSGPYLALLIAIVYLFYGIHLTYHQHQVVNKRIDNSFQRLMGILSVTRTLGTESDPQSVFDSITASCRESYDCDQVSLMIVDSSEQLEVRSVSGHLHPEEVLGTKMEIGQGVAGWVAKRREPVVLGAKVKRSSFKDFQSKAYPIFSSMIVPVIMRNEILGVLCVTSRTAKVDYDESDLQSLRVFAEYAGICCRYAGNTGSRTGQAA